MTKARFITFEGGEGSGKSTQIKHLANKLSSDGYDVITTREPGGTPSAETIRDLLVSGTVDKFSSDTEALLNYAARAEHLRRVIRPALEEGKWVLCDRFNDSTYAYQGGDVSHDFLGILDQFIVGETQPDHTFILDISPEDGLARANKRSEKDGDAAGEDRFEKKGLDYHRGIRERFLTRAAQNPDRYSVLDATKNELELAEEIHTKVLK